MGSKKLTVKFPFTFDEKYNSVMCMYKLSFGQHFFVAGCKRFHKRVLQHSEEIERKLRLGLKGPDDIYSKIIPHIIGNGIESFAATILFPIALETEIPAYEQKMFDLVRDNPFCLNTSFEAKERIYKKTEQLPERINIKTIIGMQIDAPRQKTRSNMPAPPDQLKDFLPDTANAFLSALEDINKKYAKDRD